MIRIIVDADPKLKTILSTIDKSIAYAKGRDHMMYRQIGAVVDVSTIKNFEAGGRPAWQPRKHSYAWPILRKTLSMMRKTLSYIRTNWIISGDSRALNIKSTFYGVFHQYKSKHLPERKFLLLNQDDRSMITRVIQKHIELK